MSSVYRKGRDGYFYYQAYVRCPTSGKKNKRVFKSLRTKDEIIAKSKQKELDKIYEKDLNNYKNKKMYWSLKNFIRLTIIGISLISIYLVFNNLFNVTLVSNNKAENYREGVKGIINKDSLNDKFDIQSQVDSELKKEKAILNSSKANILPKYSVEKIESLSNSFSQGKIYALVKEENIHPRTLKLLCKKLASDYAEYKNIVICLYADNIYGKEIINDNIQNLANNNHKKSWLALFTYNDVEGEYFDDNPGGYLGGN